MSNKHQLPLCDEFEQWLRDLGYDEASIRNRISNVAKINDAYGDLLTHWQTDGFESIFNDLTYTRKDEYARKANPSKIGIGGNIYNGLATYRAALRLYMAFLNSLPTTARPQIGTIGEKVRQVLENLKNTCTKEAYTQSDVKEHIMDPLVKALNRELGPDGYTFETEYTPEAKATSFGKKCKDRYDIMGKSSDQKKDNLPVIIIEVDTHRSDQVSKKMVSRIALNHDQELIYVSVLYPNNHVNRVAEKKECEKYIDYINILFTMFSPPRKHYMSCLLY